MSHRPRRTTPPSLPAIGGGPAPADTGVRSGRADGISRFGSLESARHAPATPSEQPDDSVKTQAPDQVGADVPGRAVVRLVRLTPAAHREGPARRAGRPRRVLLRPVSGRQRAAARRRRPGRTTGGESLRIPPAGLLRQPRRRLLRRIPGGDGGGASTPTGCAAGCPLRGWRDAAGTAAGLRSAGRATEPAAIRPAGRRPNRDRRPPAHQQADVPASRSTAPTMKHTMPTVAGADEPERVSPPGCQEHDLLGSHGVAARQLYRFADLGASVPLATGPAPACGWPCWSTKLTCRSRPGRSRATRSPRRTGADRPWPAAGRRPPGPGRPGGSRQQRRRPAATAPPAPREIFKPSRRAPRGSATRRSRYR